MQYYKYMYMQVIILLFIVFQKKGATIDTYDCNFAKYQPIFKILSIIERKLNFKHYAHNLTVNNLFIRWFDLAIGAS